MLGAIVGDVLGSSYEFEEMKFDWVLPHNENLKDIPLFNDDDQFTDDTVLSLAVADWLLHDIQKDYYDDEKLKIALGKRMVWWTQFYREREIAYGLSYLDFFYRTELIQEYIPQSSCGNGSAMRVSPVGWFFDTAKTQFPNRLCAFWKVMIMSLRYAWLFLLEAIPTLWQRWLAVLPRRITDKFRTTCFHTPKES